MSLASIEIEDPRSRLQEEGRSTSQKNTYVIFGVVGILVFVLAVGLVWMLIGGKSKSGLMFVWVK